MEGFYNSKGALRVIPDGGTASSVQDKVIEGETVAIFNVNFLEGSWFFSFDSDRDPNSQVDFICTIPSRKGRLARCESAEFKQPGTATFEFTFFRDFSGRCAVKRFSLVITTRSQPDKGANSVVRSTVHRPI